jgi:hypothetical protein
VPGILDVVDAASTCKELELDDEVDDAALVQSSQALPFSEGQAKLVGL